MKTKGPSKLSIILHNFALFGALLKGKEGKERDKKIGREKAGTNFMKKTGKIQEFWIQLPENESNAFEI